jgi:ribose transport system permease protein
LTAVIVGGITVGGNGDYWYTTLGALILTVLTTILVSKGFDASVTQIVFGGLILVAVAGYGRDVKPANRV